MVAYRDSFKEHSAIFRFSCQSVKNSSRRWGGVRAKAFVNSTGFCLKVIIPASAPLCEETMQGMINLHASVSEWNKKNFAGWDLNAKPSLAFEELSEKGANWILRFNGFSGSHQLVADLRVEENSV